MSIFSDRQLIECLDRNTTRLIEALDRNTDRLISVLKRPPMPGVMYLEVTSQGDFNMLSFKLTIPPPGASDVVSREVTTKIGSNDPVTVTLAADAVELDGLMGSDNDVVLASLVDIDDSNNRSTVREQSFTLKDTIPPPQPGEMGIVITGET